MKTKLNHALFLFLFLFCFNTHSFADNILKSNEVKTFGTWTTTYVELEGAVLAFAKTINNDGSTLGFLCSSKSNACLPYISLKLGCVPQSKYPMLISLPEGVYAELLLCEQVSGFYIYNLPSTYTNSLLEANKVGFAYGTGSGEFKASYFSLDGSAKALIAAKKKIQSFQNQTTPATPATPAIPKKKANEIYL